MSDHAEYAPSSAGIWLHCPASAQLAPLYKEDEDSEASAEGTIAHKVLEDALVFGQEPETLTNDWDMIEGVELATEFANELLRYPNVKLFVEKRLTVTEEVWGTTDLLAVTPDVIHVADFKYGWYPVNVIRNVQLLIYLLGAIIEFGPRPKYLITVIQPRYYHELGPIRTYEVQEADIPWLTDAIAWALANRGEFRPGSHCKFCKARGGCKALAGYLIPRLNTMMEYDLTDRHTYSNDTLAKMLDFLDMVPGFISAVRQEAFKRALNDRRIGGYKIVKGKTERTVIDEVFLRTKYEEWGIPTDALYDQALVSPLTVEKQLKARFKHDGRGKWKQRFDELSPAIGMQQGSLTLVRDTDGRPQFKKGDEFGELPIIDGEVIL